MKIAKIATGVFVVLLLLLFLIISFITPGRSNTSHLFVIPLDATHKEITTRLKNDGLIKNTFEFDIVSMLNGFVSIKPGGYNFSPSMNVWKVVTTFRQGQASIWVVVPEGLRKEEIGRILAAALKWTPAQLNEWTTIDTNQSPDYFEGVYFPSTYLLPKTETPAQAAARMIDTFNEQFAPYSKEALAQNIKWTTALKIASLVQREAKGASDAPLISGIIWNRLNQNMQLDIDSTVQYARGNTGKGWWAPITPADEKINSPYNTYLNIGLPPTPIDDPGLTAISAALNPASTTCLYYLHDSSGIIHCSDTYAEQEQNVQTYLK
jgi:UPF0755 protein